MSKRTIPDGMKKQFSESCMEIIKQRGECRNVVCQDCPFDASYHPGMVTCNDSNAVDRTDNSTDGDPVAVLSSARWIAKHGTKKAKRWLVERLCNGKAGD